MAARRDGRRPPRRRAGAAPAATALTHIQPDDLANPALYINRELSWLEFNRRVLAQASDATHPLLERVKFLAISATNLDEFFMVRVATLLKKFRAGIDDLSIDGLNTDEELEVIRARAGEQMAEQTRVWMEELRPQLAAEGIRFLDAADYTPAIDAWLTEYFETAGLPRPHAARLRPRPPVPVHLQPEHEPGGAGAPRRPHQVRAREGAGHAAAAGAAAGRAVDRRRARRSSSWRTSSAATSGRCSPARRSKARTSSASSATPTW